MENPVNILPVLNDPRKSLTGEEVTLLGEMLEKYPYFQPLHFIKAYKVFQSGRRHRSKRYLSRLAAYTGDRHILYKFFSEKPESSALPSINAGYTLESSPTVQPEKVKADDAQKVQQDLTDNSSAEQAGRQFSGNFIEWLEHLQTSGGEANNKSAGNTITKGKHNKRTNTKEEKELLDRFIRNQPKISRVKKEIYSAENMARKSIREDEELVSETLARINQKQGNYDKAIKIYEKLGLLYPDKFTYFAEQIEQLKKQKNKR